MKIQAKSSDGKQVNLFFPKESMEAIHNQITNSGLGMIEEGKKN